MKLHVAESNTRGRNKPRLAATVDPEVYDAVLTEAASRHGGVSDVVNDWLWRVVQMERENEGTRRIRKGAASR